MGIYVVIEKVFKSNESIKEYQIINLIKSYLQLQMKNLSLFITGFLSLTGTLLADSAQA